jgi:hypothetical protein
MQRKGACRARLDIRRENRCNSDIFCSGSHHGSHPEVALQVTPEVLQMLRVFVGDMQRRDLQRLLGLKGDEHFRKAYLLPVINET